MADTIRRVKIWDILVRLFHWSFALAITFAWLSHEWRGPGREWHEWLGYAALTLAGLRIVWGFVGTRYARFGDFLHFPMHYFRYLGQILTGHEKRYLGHNPLGGLMVVALLLLAVAAGVTGYVLSHRGMTLFGLGHRDLEHWHGLIGDAFVVLVPLHILGVVWESVRHRENLVGAMISGWKRAE